MEFLLVKDEPCSGHAEPNRFSIAGFHRDPVPDLGSIGGIEAGHWLAHTVKTVVNRHPGRRRPVVISVEGAKNLRLIAQT